MLYLDLAELPQALEGYWFWSARRTALARWHRKDHHGDATAARKWASPPAARCKYLLRTKCPP